LADGNPLSKITIQCKRLYSQVVVRGTYMAWLQSEYVKERTGQSRSLSPFRIGPLMCYKQDRAQLNNNDQYCYHCVSGKRMN